jgi:phosphate butyryltransferase
MSGKEKSAHGLISFYMIEKKVKEHAESKGQYKAAMPVPSDMDSLKAVIKAYENKILTPVLIGDEKLLKKKADENSISLDNIEILDINQPDMSIKTAARMAVADEVDLIVKGKGDMIEFQNLLFEKDTEFINDKDFISHIAVFKAELYKKLLILTDSFVNFDPNLKQKISILNNAVHLALQLNIECPKVAHLTAVEVIYPQMSETTEAAVLAKMCERKQIPNAVIDGPLSVDVALDPVAAEAKGITSSKVAGDADILLTGNIETANGVYKAMSLFAKAEIGGIIYGGKVPVAINPSIDSVENRYKSILLACLMCS